MKQDDVLQRLKGGLIVSCQALPHECLHSSFIMGRMALAADRGGACGIRANTVEDIREIRRNTSLPIIGIIKTTYPGSPVFITPTKKEVDALVAENVEVIAMEATARLRPGGIDFPTFFAQIRQAYPDQLFMADCGCYEDGVKAQRAGFDLIATTYAGYGANQDEPTPAYHLIERWSRDLHVPVIAEGGIWTPEQMQRAYQKGAFSVVVGKAITRPMEITRRFVAALPNGRTE